MKKITLFGLGTATIGLALLVIPTSALALGPTCDVPGGGYLTIQDAIADNTCTTINVAAGTYTGAVTINRSLNLVGPYSTLHGNDVSRTSEAVLSGQVNITASDVTVAGFEFTNPGIQMNINGASPLSGVVVENNIFNGYQSVGFPTYNAGNLLITGNLFENPLSNTESIQVKASASTLGGCNGTTVSNNVFDHIIGNIGETQFEG